MIHVIGIFIIILFIALFAMMSLPISVDDQYDGDDTHPIRD